MHPPATQLGTLLGTDAQDRPHTPQLLRLVDVSTHAPPHITRPEQLSVHDPLVQTKPVAHALPQRPQWELSAFTSMQAPPHSMRPAPRQIGTHTPALHEDPEAQVLPQRPQLTLSAAVSTQAGPHIMRAPPVHVDTHVPDVQTDPGPQALPQRPQWAIEMLRSASQPSAAFPLQFPNPPSHTRLHELLPHAAVEWGPTGQALLQAPQWATLEATSTQAVPHIIRPGPRQLDMHEPPEQTQPEGHGFPQRPQ